MRTIVGSSAGGNNYPNLTGYVPKIYDTAGDYTYTVPSNCSKLYVLVFGAGGSGGYNNIQVATGGGGGGFAAGYVSVTAGASISLTVGSGGLAPTTAEAGKDGTSTTFGTYLTGGGGKGGGFSNTWTDVSGGAGGTGTVNDTTNVSSYVTASGGRGGNWIHDTALGSFALTGGGNSGSLLGDGGNGGDMMSSNGSGRMISGGGAWGMGHAPTLIKWNTGDCDGGGGAPLNPGGAQVQYSTSQLRGRGQGMLWKGAAGYSTTTSGTDVTAGFMSSSRTDPSGAGTSWWNVLTGANFGGTAPMNHNGIPIGHGGTGGIATQVAGGMCAGNGGYNSTSWLYWGGYWVAGGGGNTVQSQLYNLAAGSALAQKHFSCGNAAGAGAVGQNYGMNGGPGLVFVFPIIT